MPLKETDIQKFELKHPGIIDIRHCVLDRARTAVTAIQISFTLAKNKISILQEETIPLQNHIQNVFQVSELS